MKLAFCLFKYFPYGGLQRDMVRIGRECIRRGHELKIHALEWEAEVPPDLAVEVLPVPGLANHIRYRRFAEAFGERLKADPADLVVGFNRMPGLDLYYAADSCYEARIRALRPSWYRLLPRYRHFSAFERAVFDPESRTEIMILAARQKEDFTRHYGTPAGRFHLLPPGISRDRIAPANAGEIRQAFRREFQAGEDDRLVLALGSGFKTKGLDRSIQALQSLPDDLRRRTRLLVVGLDDERPFRKLAGRLGLESRAVFLGGRDDVPRILLGCDLLLHPAVTENTGTVLLEAMVSGLPVLASDVCGFASHVKEAEAGLLVSSPFNQMELNRLLERMLVDPAAKEWGQNGLRFAREADLYSLIDRAADLIEDVGRRKAAKR